MPQFHHNIHAGGPQYAPPVLRPPSPSSSIGTEYGPDETLLSDRELSQSDFESKCEDALRLAQPRPEDEPILLPRPRNPVQEQELFESVMQKLRERVRRLEEDELFEQTMLRGSQIGEEELPSSGDLDTIMQSLMVTSVISPTLSRAVTSTPWNPHYAQSLRAVRGGADTSGSTAGRHTNSVQTRGP